MIFIGFLQGKYFKKHEMCKINENFVQKMCKTV